MATLPRPEPAKQAPIIDIATRQPMQPATKARGGKREPLPRLTITIPNYSKYQEPVKKGRRMWVRFDRATPNDVRLGRVNLEARWIFAALIMASEEGTVSDVTYRDLAKVIDCRPQTVQSAVESLAEEGLIQAQIKRQSNAGQTQRKRTTNAPQTPDSTPAFEELASDAGSGALQTDITGQTDIEIAEVADDEPSAVAAADASADDLAKAELERIEADRLAAIAAAEAKVAEVKAKQAERLNHADAWLSSALGPELGAALFADLKQRSLSARTDDPDEWVIRSVSGLRSKSKAAPSSLIAEAVTKSLNKSAPLSYAHSIIDNTLKEAAARGTVNQPAGRPQGSGKPLGHGMGRNGLTQPGSIWDLEL